MVKSYRVHKIAGLSGGIFLFILAVSGFFLDHDNWKFLYSTTFTTQSKALLQKNNRLLESYYIDKSNPKHIIVATLRGLYESYNGGKSFQKRLSEIITGIKTAKKKAYVSTSNGIYTLDSHHWKPFLLQGKYISSFSIYKNIVFAAQEKKYLYVIDLKTKKILNKTTVSIDKKELNHDITLSRFVRDLHYGRGLFDNDMSLLLNDYAAVTLVLLAISGYIIWYLIKNRISAKVSRKLIKLHANIFVLFASLFMLILAITGIFLDHSSALGRFMASVTVSHKILPPVYNSLKEDIWSVDYDGKFYRIGNRYGIYKSRDLKNWKFENGGFAYKTIRKGAVLYVSGMGAPNRILQNNQYKILPHTPHMFKDVLISNNSVKYISSMKKENLPLPKYSDITLYSVILAIHDGSFFASWWVWINDFAAILLTILVFTGFYRWYMKRRGIKY